MRRALLALALAWGCGLSAAPREFAYGLELFNQGDYYRAITELERFRYFEPKAGESEAALRLIAASYFKGQRWDMAARRFGEHASSYPASILASESLFFSAEALYEARRVFEARKAYQELAGQDLNEELKALAKLRLACLDLIEGRWSAAAEGFEDPRWKAMAAEGALWRPHSPWLTGLSSTLVPGSGQALAGYPLDGLSALALVGGMAAWSAFFFWQGPQEPGWVFAALTAVFHFGNVQGAVNAAKRANRDQPRMRMKKILGEVSAQPLPQPDLRPWVP